MLEEAIAAALLFFSPIFAASGFEQCPASDFEQCLCGQQSGITLSAFARRAFHRFSDREGNIFGPHEGTLQRFNPEKDTEYRIDEWVDGPTLWAQSCFERHPDGMNFWIGSLDHPHLMNALDLKKQVSLGERSRFTFSYSREESLEANRNLLSFKFSWMLPHGFTPFIDINPKFFKPDLDAEAGLRLQTRNRILRNARLGLVALDVFSDLVYYLDEEYGITPEVGLDYTRRAYAVRLASELVYEPFHAEIFADFILPDRFTVDFKDPLEGDFSQEREGISAGALLQALSSLAAGGIYTTFEQAREKRLHLDQTKAAGDYFLHEETRRVGAFTHLMPRSDTTVELRVEYVGRPEHKTYLNDPTRGTEHTDDEFLLYATVLHRLNETVGLMGGYITEWREAEDEDHSGVERSWLSTEEDRFIFRVYLNLARRTMAFFGLNVDLDPEEIWFDGGNLVFISLW